jgi:hypothetical protein
MAWSYDATLFASANVGFYPGSFVGTRYQIRLWIQDNDTNRQLFQDEEIDWQQAQEANAYIAAASLCDVLVTRARGVKSKRISEFAITYDPELYRALGAALRARGAGYQAPYAGGISIADKQAQRDDADWVPPSISRGVGDDPGAPKPAMPPINPLTTI